jgi:hypothetical protein
MVRHGIEICQKNIQFDLLIPYESVWPFALAFGEEFGIESPEIGNVPKPIDSYYWIGGPGWHVHVSVPLSEEKRFYNFLRFFCQKEGLPVKKGDLKPSR